MKAYQLIEWQQPAELRDVPVPEPEPGEVLIKVGGAGACHSDLHVMDWPPGTLPYELPFTLGHENAGSRRISSTKTPTSSLRSTTSRSSTTPTRTSRCPSSAAASATQLATIPQRSSEPITEEPCTPRPRPTT